MKLRNKLTGEIPDKIETIAYIQWSKKIMVVYINNDGERIMKQYDSLEAFNKEWEDAPEEPKPYWYIDFDGEIDCDNNIDLNRTDSIIGNYFETREEAELAVRKLKAWKRLKDKGFEFTGWYGSNRIIHFRITSLDEEGDCLPHFVDDDTANDLDLLFNGGEE